MMHICPDGFAMHTSLVCRVGEMTTGTRGGAQDDWTGVGIAIGAGVGIILGTMAGNMTMGIAIGITLGIVCGATASNGSRRG